MKRAKPDGEDPPAAEPVAERAEDEQERGERERVGVDDPLQVAEAGVEVLAGSTGSATLTMVMSSSSMNVATQTASRVHHLRSIS